MEGDEEGKEGRGLWRPTEEDRVWKQPTYVSRRRPYLIDLIE
jgi:hypothetical protein